MPPYYFIFYNFKLKITFLNQQWKALLFGCGVFTSSSLWQDNGTHPRSIILLKDVSKSSCFGFYS